MNNKKFKINNNKINIIKTDKFKSVQFLFNFKRPIKKEEITINNCLMNMLDYGSKNYNSSRKINIKLQDLYSAQLYYKSTRSGNYLVNNIFLKVFDDKYTESGNIEEAIKFISDYIYNPNVNNNKFDRNILKIVKKNIKDEIINCKENSSFYSTMKLEEYYDNTSIRYNKLGYIEDLDKINEENLYEYYIDFINNNYLEIYVCGDIDDNIIDILKKYIKSESKDYNISNYLEIKKYKDISFYKETINDTQSNLSIFCNIEELNQYERDYIMPLYNSILGGGIDSKFFKNIREENSLCYSIYSTYSLLDNLLLIKSGINKDNYDKTIDLIKKNMKDMNNGNFSDEDIDKAKEIFISYIDETLEYQIGIISNYYSINNYNIDDINIRKEKIREVSKEDIIELSKKIRLDTIFLLEGVLNGED